MRRATRAAPHFCALALGLVALPAIAADAASTFPARPLRFIVPYSAGGIADVLARILGQRLGTLYGRQVVIDNRPGAGGHNGGDLVVKAPPDGHTIMLGTIAHNAAYAMYLKLPYDPAKDLRPIVVIADSAGVLVVHPSMPTRTVKEFVALAKAKPGELNYGSAGHGSAIHMAAELFKLVAQVNLNHIAYKGSAPAMADLIGGQIHVMFENIATALPHVESKRIRALGVTSPKRSALLPELPAIGETVPGYAADVYYTVSTHAQAPNDIVRKLAADLDAIIRSPELAARWRELGVTPVGGTPDDARKRNVVETERWSRVIREAGIKAD
jgi:tripartite-type tricarboxylate transporter receptor subunit TctC